MRVFFPSSVLDPKSVDESFAAERDAARSAGFDALLLDSEALDAGEFARAVRRVSEAQGDEVGLYRGWMLRAPAYQGLYEALARRGHRLINSPEQYRHAHHFPESYDIIRGRTPNSVWTTTGAEVDVAALTVLLAPFGDAPVIVKDYVKSQKHYWTEACFIHSALDVDAVRRVVTRFVELQEGSFTGGLVFREFVELEALTTHSKSGMPLTKEFRVFVLDGKPLATVEYWEEGEYEGARPPVELFIDLAGRVQSRFFTMDVACRTNGEWIIMELGDGQVAGLPERLEPARFYEALAARFV